MSHERPTLRAQSRLAGCRSAPCSGIRRALLDCAHICQRNRCLHIIAACMLPYCSGCLPLTCGRGTGTLVCRPTFPAGCPSEHCRTASSRTERAVPQARPMPLASRPTAPALLARSCPACCGGNGEVRQLILMSARALTASTCKLQCSEEIRGCTQGCCWLTSAQQARARACLAPLWHKAGVPQARSSGFCVSSSSVRRGKHYQGHAPAFAH